MQRTSLFLLLLPAALLAAVPASAQEPAPTPQSLIERYITDQELLTTVYSDPLAPVTRQRMQKFHDEAGKQLAAIDFKKLDQEGKIDYLLMANHLKREAHAATLADREWHQVEPLLPIASDVFAIEEARREIKRPDGEATARKLSAMAEALATRRHELETGKQPDRIVAWRAAADLDEMRGQLHNWFGFYNGYDPQFTWWVEAPYQKLDAAMKDYASFLREKLAGVAPDDRSTVIGVPLGRQPLLDSLSDEMIPYTPEDLVTMAKEEMAWCQKQMIQASREMGYGDDWHKALEKVKSQYVEAGKQPELIKALALEGDDFVRKNNLVTVPELASEGWRMEMMTPEQQLVNPFFTGGSVISVSYPVPSMTVEQRLMSMRGNNVAFSHATVFHELIPGHWLQEYSQARYRPYRQLFNTGFWVEGNALYWEMMLWDKGFQHTPEERIGALFWRMHRCARVIFTISFHLGKMTPDEAVNYLVNEVGHERDNAIAEVRRSFNGDYDPLYQCAYLTGGVQFRALRHELVDGGKMTDRQFNDAILHENNMPIEMLRALLENQPLSTDYQPQWHFLGATR